MSAIMSLGFLSLEIYNTLTIKTEYMHTITSSTCNYQLQQQLTHLTLAKLTSHNITVQQQTQQGIHWWYMMAGKKHL